MPYVYRPVGWTYASNSVYPNGAEPKAHFFYPLEGANGFWATNQPVGADIAAVVEPKWHGTRNQWRPSTGMVVDQKSKTSSSDYFGGLYDPGIEPPETRVLDLGSWRRKPKVSYGEFLKRKQRGEIVANPIDTYAASATVYSGIYNGVNLAPLRVLLKRGQFTEFPLTYSPLFKRKGLLFPSQPGRATDTFAVVTDNIWVCYDRYFWPAGYYPWYKPTDSEVWELAILVRESVVSARKTSLVTAAMAEANNKNWDILTELAEAPEAIRFILGVLHQILRLCRDFKKEVARLRKEYYRAGGGRNGSHEAAWATILSNKWLEFRYAVEPLVYSVESALDFLTSGDVEYQTTRKGEEEPVTLAHTNWEISEFSVRHRCWIKRRFAYNSDTWTSNSNYLTTNPLVTAWELTKLSFVIDWAVNVGDYLASLVEPSGVIQQAAVYSTHLKRTTIVCKHKTHTGTEVHLNLGRYIAEPFQPYDHTGLTVSLDLNWKRALDALALSWQGIKRLYGR